MAGGRPTKYTPELLTKAHEYVEKWQLLGDVVPQVASLAIHCGISTQRIYEWIKDDEKAEFRDVYTRVMDMQFQGLVNKGLCRETDSGLTKLMLHKHGLSDKQEIDHTTNGKDITNPTADDLAEKLKDLGIEC